MTYKLYRDETACDSDDFGPPHGEYLTLALAMVAAGLPVAAWRTVRHCPDEIFTCKPDGIEVDWQILAPGAAAELTSLTAEIAVTGPRQTSPDVSRIPIGADAEGNTRYWGADFGPDVLVIAEEMGALREAMQARVSASGAPGKSVALDLLRQLAWQGRIESSVPPSLRLVRRIFRDAWQSPPEEN